VDGEGGDVLEYVLLNALGRGAAREKGGGQLDAAWGRERSRWGGSGCGAM
jgi:hypothetical protein